MSDTDDTNRADKTMLKALADNPSQFNGHTIRVIADAALRKIARLEGYSDGLAERLRQVRLAAGCSHE